MFLPRMNTYSLGRNTYRLYCWYRSRAPKNAVRAELGQLAARGGGGLQRTDEGHLVHRQVPLLAALLPTTRSPSVM